MTQSWFMLGEASVGRVCRALLAAVFVLLGACVSPPVQEMSDARQAIAAARDAGAPQLAAEQLGEAEGLLENAERHLEEGIYDLARREAVKAKDLAFEALLASRDARDAAEGAVQQGGETTGP